jgi:ribonuclease HI
MIVVHTDGLCEPRNPGGHATYGAVIDGLGYISQLSGDVGSGPEMTNQVAEYYAVFKALEYLVDERRTTEKVIVYTDSQLVANQMNGEWRAKGGRYLGIFLKTKELARQFRSIVFQWIPREENKEADRLSRIAYEDYCASSGRRPIYYKR